MAESIADPFGSGDPTPYERLPERESSIASVIPDDTSDYTESGFINPLKTQATPVFSYKPPTINVPGDSTTVENIPQARGSMRNVVSPVPQITPPATQPIVPPDPDSDKAKDLRAPAEAHSQFQQEWLNRFRQFGINAHNIEDAYRRRTEYRPGELPGWDAEAQMRRYSTDPISSFGSLGSIFGIMAAAFTRHPMTNALNASAAAMTAVREGDEDAYNKSYKAWQDNTKLALDRHNLMQKDYDNIIGANERDSGRMKSLLEMEMHKYKDDTALAIMRTYGVGPELMDYIAKRNKSIVDAHAITQATTQDMFRQKMFEERYKYNNETIADPHQAAAANMRDMGLIMGMELDSKNERQALTAQMLLTHGPNTADPWPVEKILDEVNKQVHFRHYGRSASDQTQRILERQEELIRTGQETDPAKAHRRAADEVISADATARTAGKPLSLSQGDYIRVQRRKLELMEQGKSETEADSQSRSELERDKAAGRAEGRPGGKSAQEAQIAELLASGTPENIQKANALMEARRKVSEELSTKDKLTDLTLKQKAEQYIAGDAGARSGLGRSGEIIRLDNAIAKLMEERGITPEQLKINQAEFGGLKQAERTIYQRSASISVSAAEAAVGLELVRKYNELVPRGKFIPINSLLTMAQEKISDPNLWGLRQAINTFVNQYANTISRTGSGTVSDKEHARESMGTINGRPVASKEALEEVLKVAEQEIEAAKNAPREAQRLFRSGLSLGASENSTIRRIIKDVGTSESPVSGTTSTGTTYRFD